MSQNLANVVPFNPCEHSVDECLIELRRYGYPIIISHKDGWYTRVKVFVSGDGVEFEVKSDYRMKTPGEALNQCYDRLMLALKKIKDTE